MPTYTAKLINPACGTIYDVKITADTHELAIKECRRIYGVQQLVAVRHVPDEEYNARQDRSWSRTIV